MYCCLLYRTVGTEQSGLATDRRNVNETLVTGMEKLDTDEHHNFLQKRV